MGKIELDHTGSGSGITLSSDGTDLLLDGTAIGGGGGADLYAANESSPTAQPSATGTNAIAIGDSATTAGNDGVAIGKQSKARALESLGLFGDAQNSQSISIGKGSATTADGAVQLGRNGYATGTDAVSLGKSRASGSSSFSAAITSNSSTYGGTSTNAVAIGQLSRATSTRALAMMNNAIASGADSVAVGRSTDATASSAFAFGYHCLASGNNSFATGYQSKAATIGKAAYASGSFSGSYDGDAQQGTYVLRSDTTDATAEALTTNNGTAGTTNQIILSNTSALSFHGTIVAREDATDGTDCAAWEVKGLIRREASASTTTLVNSSTTVVDNTPSWGMALSADTTNGCLKIQVTGAASTNIRWVATIHTSEVTYA